MKKLIYLGLLLFSAGMAQAQVKWTPEIGVSMTKSLYEGQAYKVTPQVGIGMDYFFNGNANKWGIGTGLYFYQKKEIASNVFYTREGNNLYYNYSAYIKDLNNADVKSLEFSQSNTHREYLQIPVMVKYKHDLNENIAIGIGFGGFGAYRIGGKENLKQIKWNDTSNKFTSEEQNGISLSSDSKWEAGITSKVSLYAHQFVVNCGYELNLLHHNTQNKQHLFSLSVGYSF